MSVLIPLKAKHRIIDGAHIEGRKDSAGAGPRRKASKGGNSGRGSNHTWAHNPANARLLAEERATSAANARPRRLVLRNGKRVWE
ncbi:MAG TPA: hypothetical protein VGW38_09230 [Chloroflexota bacterium]|nr:hypothetical protein [Chloroflexota bacterium]